MQNITVKQVKAARQLLGWNQSELAKRSEIALPTVKAFERKGGLLSVSEKTLGKVLKAFALGGVKFIDKNGGGAGVRLKV